MKHKNSINSAWDNPLKRNKYNKILMVLLFLSVSFKGFSQLGFHISNYKGDVIFARALGDRVIPVDTLTGYGLYIYSDGRLAPGIYLFQAGNKRVEFPLGEDQNFRLIADYSSNDIQSTVQVAGSVDNSIFQKFLILRSDSEKMNFMEKEGSLVNDPFIRSCMQAMISAIPSAELEGADKQNYILSVFSSAMKDEVSEKTR